MRRPRKFLSLIVILLVINVLFFSIWYPWGGRDYVRKWITAKVGDLANADFSLGDLNISDRQILAQEINFATRDSLFALEAKSIRIRYSLYQLILSGFKIDQVISSIEIIDPIVQIHYVHVPKQEQKPKQPFEIPDLSSYFSELTLEGGEVSAYLKFPIKMMQDGYLEIEESLHDVELRVHNDAQTQITLNTETSLGGEISFNGIVDKGRIDLAKAEIVDFRPLYIAHPDLEGFRTEVYLSASYSEPADSSAASYSGKAMFWDTSAFVMDKYPVDLSYISMETDGKDAELRIDDGRIATSLLEAELRIQDFAEEMSFDGSKLAMNLNLRDIMPALSGRIYAQLNATGNLKDPRVKLDASAARLAYQNWAIDDILVNAEYQDETATISIPQGRWENQDLDLKGFFKPKTMEFGAELLTAPVALEDQPLIASGKLSVEGILLKPYPMLTAFLSGIDVNYNDLNLEDVSGYVKVVPTDESLLFDTMIESSNGFAISAVGDILDRHITLDADFGQLEIDRLYSQDVINTLSPLVSGSLSAIMHNDKIWLKSKLDTELRGEYDYYADLDLLGSVDLKSMQVSAALKTAKGELNGQPLNLDLNLDYANQQLKIWQLKLEDFLNLSGRVNLADWQDLDIDLALCNLDRKRLIGYHPDLELMIPDFQNLNLFAKYNRDKDRQLAAQLNLNALDLLSIIPIDINLNLAGIPEALQISGNVDSGNKLLLSLDGESSLLPEIDLKLQAMMQDLKMQDLLIQPPGRGNFSGMVELLLKNASHEDREMEFSTDLIAKNLRFGDFDIDLAIVKAEQQSQALVVDTLYVVSNNLFEAHAQGALDYNAIQNLFYVGDKALDVSVSGELFPWLKNLTDYIHESHGTSNLTLKVGTSEDQFMVQTGELDIHDGYIHLQDQVEPMRNIQIKGFFEDNRFVIQNAQFQMGNGSFYMNNIFDPDPSEHFMLSFIDLGYLRLMIQEPGLQATIPMISPPKSLSNIALRGQDSRYATIRGPFDDMKIDAYVIASNLDILFPPGADNLLNLIMSVRSTGKKPDSDPVPLPFHLNLIVAIGENVRYVTYPTNFYLVPGGYLHLVYDGNRFIVEEANINSERGSMDFFGTVFQVDNIAVNMIDQQNILNVSGTFYKRTPDGSTITLSVSSSPDFEKSIFDRLQINLASDNPSDQNISQVLSRLRYNQSMDDIPNDQKQNLFQDEALGLIGGNLNSTVLTPFFYPAENWVRRTLRLDSFSINAGFIQNLFTEYSSDPSQLADLADMSNFSSDITQFSSSILLNNLSLSMSKYIGYRMFVDYDLTLQEATDLQTKTKILVSHDASLRLILPKQYRLGYTLNYAPEDTRFSHEIMLQKSLRFWGL